MTTTDSLRSQVATSSKQNGQPEQESRDGVVERLVHPELNRLYRLTECHDLFGEICLFIEWGRHGRRLRSRLEPFPDHASRDKRKHELLARRRQHGYVA